MSADNNNDNYRCPRPRRERKESRLEQAVRYAGDTVRDDGDGIACLIAVAGGEPDGDLGLFRGDTDESAEMAAIAAGAVPIYVSAGMYDWRTALDCPVAEIDDEAIIADYAAPPRWGRRPQAADRDWCGLDALDYPVTSLKMGLTEALFASTSAVAVDNRLEVIAGRVALA